MLPEANRAEAERIIAELRERHPRRRLKLESVETLTDVVDNRNIIRAERVCMGEYVIRKARNFSRLAKVQVPVLAVLVYTLLAVWQTRTFAPWWYDWRIADVQVLERGFKTLNADGEVLWESPMLDHPIAVRYYDTPEESRDHWVAIDDDHNGRDELCFAPAFVSTPATVQFYDDRGRLVWDTLAFHPTTYPGDTEYQGGLERHHMYVNSVLRQYTDEDDSTWILVSCTASEPARTQIRRFSVSGPVDTCVYLHPGAMSLTSAFFTDADEDGRKEMVLKGTNNRYDGVSLVVLDPKRLAGVSPPYDNDLFVMSGMPKGSQLFYVRLPETPLSSDPEVRNGAGQLSHSAARGKWEISVIEGIGLSIDGHVMRPPDETPQIYYNLDSNLIPTRVYAGDGAFKQLNDLLEKIGRPLIKSRERLLDSLKSEVVVYHGDSIVHHEAAGIYSYGEPE